MKLRTLAQVGVMCLVTLLMVCADAQAQPGGGRRGGGQGFGGQGFGGGRGGFGGGGLGIVERTDVQDELKLTDAQITAIETASEDARGGGGQGRGGFENFQDLSDEERQEAFARLAEERTERLDAARAKVKETLNADQAKRLGELEIQYAIQQVENNPQLQVLAAYLEDAKAAAGEPFTFETLGGGRGRGRGGDGTGAGGGRRRGRGDAGADAGNADAGDAGNAGGRRRRAE